MIIDFGMLHLIITTANIEHHYKQRKQHYIESIEACLKYAHLFDSYTVLECVSANEEYLNGYNTVYSAEGNLYGNKGLNEMNHLKSFLNKSAFGDNQSIIKLSGKYVIKDDYFFNKVLELQTKFDSILKNDKDVYDGNGYHTFFYYMKKKVLMDAINSLEFSWENDRPIEWDIKDYLLTRDRHIEIDRLGVLAKQGTFSEKVFYC